MPEPVLTNERLRELAANCYDRANRYRRYAANGLGGIPPSELRDDAQRAEDHAATCLALIAVRDLCDALHKEGAPTGQWEDGTGFAKRDVARRIRAILGPQGGGDA